MIKMVEASYVNTSSISCTVPHGEGNTTVSVASNGVDFVGDVSFAYAPSVKYREGASQARFVRYRRRRSP